MSLAFQCEQCGKDFVVGDELAGKRCRCKQCGHVFAIPSGRSNGPAPAPPRASAQPAAPRRSRSPESKSSPQRFARERVSNGVEDPYGIDDPYGFEDEVKPKMPPRAEPDLGEILPQRPRVPKKHRGKRSKSESWNQSNFPAWAILFGILISLFFTGLTWRRNSADLTFGWFVLAFVLNAIRISGVLGLLGVAYREGAGHAIGCLFIPFYLLYYAYTRWDRMSETFTTAFIGGILVILGTAYKPEAFHFSADTPLPRMAGVPDHARPPGPWMLQRPGPGFPQPNPGPPVAPAPARVILSDFTDQVLADLKAPEPRFRHDALRRLKNAPPNDRREEVAKAIEPLLSDPDGFCRSDAASALAVWGGPESTPALIKGLKDPAFNVRWAILDAFRDRPDPKAADALVDYMMTSDDRGKAAEALQAIGPAAEDAVIRGLNHHDDFARLDTCKILQAIGTLKSVPALQDLVIANKGHGLDSMAARDALKQIQFRHAR